MVFLVSHNSPCLLRSLDDRFHTLFCFDFHHHMVLLSPISLPSSSLQLQLCTLFLSPSRFWLFLSLLSSSPAALFLSSLSLFHSALTPFGLLSAYPFELSSLILSLFFGFSSQNEEETLKFSLYTCLPEPLVLARFNLGHLIWIKSQPLNPSDGSIRTVHLLISFLLFTYFYLNS